MGRPSKRLRKPETHPSSSRSNPNPDSFSTSEPPSIRLETVPPPPPEGTSIITDDRLSALPHVLHEEIFLRLATPTDLVRASAACVSFRRLVTRRSFLRRFRRCHSPPLLGFMDWDGFSQVLPPHPSAPVARAVARAADFSFSFLPSPVRYSFTLQPGCWNVRDTRDGRVLLDRVPETDYRLLLFTELAVCDPLHRQYRLLPPIPDDLAALVRDPLEVSFNRCSDAILVPPAPCEQEEVEETSFRVIWMAQCTTRVVATVYSSTTGQWEPIASQSWSDLFVGQLTQPLKSSLFGTCQYAYGCLYWSMKWVTQGLNSEAMLMLDTIRMEFALADYPPGIWRGRRIGIVEAGEGRLGSLSFSNGTSEIRYSVRGNASESSNEWQTEKIIPLGEGYHSVILPTERYLLLRKENFRVEPHIDECFSLDVKTFQLDRVPKKSVVTSGPIYANFPPSLSSRTI